MTSASLAILQRPDGGFASVVTSRQGHAADCNGFTAALVVRTVRHVPTDAVLRGVRARALGFVARCASDEASGAYSFWPAGMRPSWARSVPADVDDTALALTEFVRHGWIARDEAIGRVASALLPHRVTRSAEGERPPWIIPGSFYTWIAPASSRPASVRAPNVVDCCVNANVVALLSFIGATRVPGYDEAVQTIRNGVQWAGGDPRRLQTITPFYPSVGSLADAVAHAVECGAPLADVANDLSSLDADTLNDGAGCCRSAYGSTVWHCEAVDVARALARSARRSPANEAVPAVAG